MKKFKLFALLIGLIMCTCIAFSACYAPQEQEPEQISEAMRMYLEAVEAGYEGDYLDFLNEYLNPKEDDSDEDAPTPIVSGADLAALSAVKIESTFKIGAAFGPQSRTATASGSGVILSLDTDTYDAYILTNYHVVYELSSIGTETIPHVSEDIGVWLFGGEIDACKLSATFVGGAIDYDVAVLLIDGSDVVTERSGQTHTNASVLQNSAARPITIGNSDDVSVGDTVYAIGNANAKGISVTHGVISVEAEYITMTALNSSFRSISLIEMRIDAAINHGNSGGGLFNEKGEYVGTVNARSEETGVVGFGYALPANLTVAIAQNVIAARTGGTLYANLGISTEILSSRSVYDEQTGVAHTEESVGVSAVNFTGAAAGVLERNDVLLSVTLDGVTTKITRDFQLICLCFNLRSGNVAEFEILRDGAVMTVNVVLTSADFTTIY